MNIFCKSDNKIQELKCVQGICVYGSHQKLIDNVLAKESVLGVQNHPPPPYLA